MPPEADAEKHHPTDRQRQN